MNYTKMKKKILILMALIVGTLTAYADNTVSVSSALIPQGKIGSFNIELTNTDAFVAFEMKLTLPDGITFESATKGNRYEESHSMGVSANGQTITITLNSGTNQAIKGNNGALITVSVSADADIEVGTKLSAILSGMEFARKDESFIRPEAINFDIEITDRVILDENSTIAPTAQSGVNVLVKRTIKKDMWNTIVLPFTLSKTNVTNIFGSDAQFAEFTGFEVDYGDDESNVTPLGIVINLKNHTIPRAGITGGKPLLVKVTEDIDNFEVDNVNIISTVNPVEKEDEINGLSGMLTGSFIKTTIPLDGLFISDDKFWYSTGLTKIKAFRCWFELGAVLGKDTDFGSRISLFFDDDEIMGISTKYNSECIKHNHIFDLQGRRVVKPTKGLYIKNGKKEVVR